MDAARSLVFTNVAIALLTRIYVLAIHRDDVLDPGQGARVSKHFTNDIVSVSIELPSQNDKLAAPRQYLRRPCRET